MKSSRHFNIARFIKPKAPIFYLEIFTFLLVVSIFGLKLANYSHSQALNPVTWINSIDAGYRKLSYSIAELKYFGSCRQGQLKIAVGQQYLCRDPIAPSVYQKIFDTYPRNPNGQEVIYPYLNELSVKTADDLLKNQYDINRYLPVNINGPLSWREDPYNDAYWRFNFYSLRDLKDLLNAGQQSRDPKYNQKLLEITNSFLATGVNQPHAWDYTHAVAWRGMMLTDIWWKLRSQNQLPIATSNELLAQIQTTANFLLDPNHYEANYNHGTNEAAALYLMGVAFPSLPGSSQWRASGQQRLADSIAGIIDADGALNEHSPYYDLYALVKYWDVYVYANKFHRPISQDYNSHIKAMVNYAAYVLMPNLHVPLIGASIDIQIHAKNEFAQMGNQFPAFNYVLTKGRSGRVPPKTAIQFKATGQTILRSGWQPKNYSQQTQLIFNYGNFLTAHSQLNSLSIQLYGGGSSLLTGPGLYTYNPGPLKNYFTGTSSQNTVLVDGSNQKQGTGYAGDFIEGAGYSTQAASNLLNSDVIQKRQVTMIGRKTVVVIDKLTAPTSHTYQQLFHLFPGASYTQNGLTATAMGQTPQQHLTIYQLGSKAMTLSDTYDNRSVTNPGGICSVKYNQLVPCHQIAYTQKGKTVTFITVLAIGKPDSAITYRLDAAKTAVTVTDHGKNYTIAIAESGGRPLKVSASNTKAPVPQEAIIDKFIDPRHWQTSGGSLNTSADSYPGGSGSLNLNSAPGQLATISQTVSLDLSNKNLLFRLKAPIASNIKDLDIIVYSKDGSYAQNRLKNSYDDIHDSDQSSDIVAPAVPTNNGWSAISLGKGRQRGLQGQWSIYGNSFDWSTISSVAFRVSSVDGSPVTISLGQLATTPGQSSGKVAFVFDDGTTSVLSAFAAMQKYGYQASVAVIGKYPGRDATGYLSVSQLRDLKNARWSLINHSYFHEDAVAQYYFKNNLDGFEQDVIAGAQFLEANNLDTDPNWYIYPHGTTNQALEAVLGKYYKFGRTELTAPEVFPFGNALAVKDFIVQNDTTPQEVENAIADANSYHETLLITFHRIHSSPTDRPGYEIANFNHILAYLKQSHSTVMSLNQLDKSNGVSLNQLSFSKFKAPQLTANIKTTDPSLWYRLKQIL